MNVTRVVLTIFVTIVFLFLLSPIFVLIPAAFTTAQYATFPPIGFTLRWFNNIGTYPDIVSSIEVSLEIAAVATAISLLAAVPASFVIVRSRFRARGLLNAFFSSPLSVPWIILGIALLLFYSEFVRIGPNTVIGIVAGHVIVITPFVLRVLIPSLTGLDRSLEEASMSLGAGRVRTAFKITFPLIKAGIISGALFAFLLSFNDLTIALFLSGPTIAPFPVTLFRYLSTGNYDPTIAALVSLIILAMVLVSVVLGRFFKAYTPSVAE